jgi:hypothetical protein
MYIIVLRLNLVYLYVRFCARFLAPHVASSLLPRVGDAGAQALAAALPHNATLKALYLQNNRVTDKGVGALCEGVRANGTVAEIDLGGNKCVQAKSCCCISHCVAFFSIFQDFGLLTSHPSHRATFSLFVRCCWEKYKNK